ncbi:MAG: Rne/Rng family ribonuclease, partial [Jatrophihabitans sp.]|uniref:Rne/Rng family ribonuclease n=1 Tax=Jatrophihabitans sp. TaxID=1932789 RepID=UPI003F7D9F4A
RKATAPAGPPTDAVETTAEDTAEPATPALAAPAVLFQAPDPAAAVPVRGVDDEEPEPGDVDLTVAEDAEDHTAEPDDVKEAAIEQAIGARRRRRRGRRGRGGAAAAAAEDETGDETEGEDEAEAAESGAEGEAGEGAEGAASTSTRRRRRRQRAGSAGDGDDDNPPNTVVHVREPKKDDGDDGVRGVKGSTRLEAKRQRRRDGRETGRRRAPILSEAEFLARREAVDRVMAVRQSGDRTQIAVLEDGVLVEHYVTRASSQSYVGNVYLGRVQNVLPSMEAAFIDIGKGRNGVLYAGEVNWDAAGLEGKARAIENALKPGDNVLVQVTKDPIGHKGARLTSQVTLPGRYLVYVPGGGMTGISRRLPDTERHRLKSILKKIVPEDAGVIVRTAAEGASEEDLTRDVERLQAQWETIAAHRSEGKAPVLVHGEPDLAIRVVRDVFNEDFKQVVIQGEDAHRTIADYVTSMAPDLAERVSRHASEKDLFAELRVDEQLMMALDRKVWLPSGGSLVIDRTEAMTVIDVNTGKFVGSGGNLEQTVTRNNLEAAEEIVRQLRLRDVGGIVVIDFIDMVLESNRELVLRRLTECLGRDRTKHQVAEVTSLGLVQMTRKRVGEGLLEAFSETCPHCNGRGVLIHAEPVDKSSDNGAAAETDDERGSGGTKGRRRRGSSSGKARAAETPVEPPATVEQRRAALAAMEAIHRAAHQVDEHGNPLPDDGVLPGPVDGAGAPEAAAEPDADAAAAAGVDAVGEALAVETGTVGSDGLVAAELAADVIAAVGAQSEQTAEAVAEAADIPVVAEPADLADTPAEAPSFASVPEREAAAEPAVPVEAAVEADQDAPRASGRPRRRRAASRPAGPPVPTTS